MNGRHAVTSDRPTYPEVKEQFGEDPARYLAVDENDPHDDHPLALAHARIRALDDLAHIKAWQRIEAENWGRREVMAHLNARERELTGAEPIPEPDADPTSEKTSDEDRESSIRSPTPATATDGGTTITSPDNSVKESHTIDTTAGSETTTPPSSGTDPASDSIDQLHPDCKGLEAGQVLELERADGTEYIFPAQPAADEPFLRRSFDEEDDERTADPIPLSLGEVASRPINDTDPKPVSEIDTRAPALAATKGGSQ